MIPFGIKGIRLKREGVILNAMTMLLYPLKRFANKVRVPIKQEKLYIHICCILK